MAKVSWARKCSVIGQEDRASAFERAIGPQAARPGNGGARLISVGGHPPHATGRAGTPEGPPLQRDPNQPGLAIKALAKGSGCLTGPPVGFRRHEGRDGRGPAQGRLS